MLLNQQNRLSIDKIDLIVHHENAPGDDFRLYCNGRGVCGLVVAISGKSKYIFKDGTEKEISAGEAVLFSDKIAYVVVNNSDEPFDHYTINFTLSNSSDFEQDMLVRPFNFSKFASKCEKLFQFWQSGEPSAELRCMSVLYELVADFLENNLIDTVGYEQYKTILPAIHYIDQNFSSDINIDTLARLCIMSNTNFRRIFTKICSLSPIQYLLDVRVNRAREFLKQSNKTIEEIAHLTGFKDVEYFCRTYKKRTGITPTQERRI